MIGFILFVIGLVTFFVITMGYGCSDQIIVIDGAAGVTAIFFLILGICGALYELHSMGVSICLP